MVKYIDAIRIRVDNKTYEQAHNRKNWLPYFRKHGNLSPDLEKLYNDNVKGENDTF